MESAPARAPAPATPDLRMATLIAHLETLPPDQDAGRPDSPGGCALALLAVHQGFDGPTVCGDNVFWWGTPHLSSHEKRLSAGLPPDSCRFVRAFDRRRRPATAASVLRLARRILAKGAS